ncbi:hypothetical protein FRAAL6361 [Frankia alni ACN14a]|uniref:Uncharacterized protein n=1 Tax=Frankia alni (strain DSM 45986 / CECT 9034 / ACN14a) TaxID=326424 RepID=Q0RC44_FRAAA|nr:hypothetical protein FRAAL6361 [Frankia alni ACN14a]
MVRPADRATAAIHAFLDAGSLPAALNPTLAAIDRGAIRDGLAIVDHWLTRLCETAGVDPVAYPIRRPEPATTDSAPGTSFDRADIHHLAGRPNADLALELRTLRAAVGLPEHLPGRTRPSSASYALRALTHRFTRLGLGLFGRRGRPET